MGEGSSDLQQHVGLHKEAVTRVSRSAEEVFEQGGGREDTDTGDTETSLGAKQFSHLT